MSTIFDPVNIPFPGADPETEISGSDLVVFGAPHGTPYRDIDNEPYAAAPDRLRSILKKYASWLDHWDFDLGGPLLENESFVIADAGNLKTSPLDGPGNRHLIKEATTQIVSAGAIPIMMGGDDSTPIPFIEALAPAGPLTIVQLDAHIDWRDERYAERYGFSSTMRRSSEWNHVEKIIQIGIRGPGSARSKEVELAREWGARIVTAREFHRNGIESLTKHLVKGANCMITLDVDALDSSVMPAVMAPTPGGLSYIQTIDIIDAVVELANIVAFDMIELVPERDRDGTASMTAARILAYVVGRLARK